jgi:hypothetical protein
MTRTPRTFRRPFRLALVAPLAVVGVVACGDDDDAESLEADVRADITEASEVLEERASEISEAAEDVRSTVEDIAAEAVELAVRNVAARAGEAEFESAGHPLAGGLDCTASATDGMAAVDIDCTGTTAAGETATLTGTVDAPPGESVVELNGSFTGTVDGAEVFTTNRLGV